jgi:hypothetical protein
MSRLMRSLGISIIFFLIVLFASFTSGHVPRDSGNNSGLSSTEEINNPTKSWAIYGHLKVDEENHYYSAYLKAGANLVLSLSRAIREENDGFSPQIIIFGKEFTENPTLPGGIEKPDDYGWIIVNNNLNSKNEYEPFGPGYYYSIAEIEYVVPENNKYYIVVTADQEGYYLMAVGRSESFTLEEWITTPLRMISVYQWEGQSWLLITIPWALTLLLTGFFIWVRNSWNIKNLEVSKKFLLVMSIPFFGSSIQFFFQIIISVYHAGLDPGIVISIVLGILPFLLGMYHLKTILNELEARTMHIKLIVISFIALFFWTGYVVFPVVIIGFSLLSISRTF